MKKILIFLIFISFVFNLELKREIKEIKEKKSEIAPIKCKGGLILNKVCKCPMGKKLLNGECKSSTLKCKGGKLESGVCKCNNGTLLFLGECLELKECPPRSIREGNTCKICGFNQISEKNKCITCPKFSSVFGNKCKERYRPPFVKKKPVIYLYPEEPMDISVKLNLKNSKFTTIYPKFNGINTWNVHAKPNGDILIKDKTYPYLFWEAESYNPQEQNEGFLVTNENAEQFLEDKLNILGLNEKEKTDFITYWLPVLLRNKLSLCTFQTDKFFENCELNITPKPDSLIRVFLTIKKLDNPINIKEQNLKSIERRGFSVIEWGGSNF